MHFTFLNQIISSIFLQELRISREYQHVEASVRVIFTRSQIIFSDILDTRITDWFSISLLAGCSGLGDTSPHLAALTIYTIEDNSLSLTSLDHLRLKHRESQFPYLLIVALFVVIHIKSEKGNTI